MFGFTGVPWNKLSYVYVIRNAELGLYKIGYTDSLPRRLQQLQRASSCQLDVWTAWKCPKTAARAFEAMAHEKFKDGRTHGEWFRIDQHILDEMRRGKIIAANAIHRKHDPLRLTPYHVHLMSIY